MPLMANPDLFGDGTTTPIRLSCPSCGAGPMDKHIAGPMPSMEELGYWVYDSVAEATDGCEVEPDGYCEHGHHSWLRVLGLI